MGFGKIFKKVKKFALPTIGALIGSALLGPAGAGLVSSTIGGAIGSGAGTLASGGDVKDALLSGAGSYVGGSIAGGLGGGGSTIGTATGMSTLPWSAANTGFGQSIGNLIGQSTANTIAGTSVNRALGSYLGSEFAQNAFGDDDPQPQITPSALPAAPAGPTPFTPQQQAEKELPSGLTSSLGSLTPEQRSTNLATQGTYGGGLGPMEQEYYVNQAQRRLVDPAGGVADPNAVFNDIEKSYLKRLGLGGYSSGLNLAELISQWRPA